MFFSVLMFSFGVGVCLSEPVLAMVSYQEFEGIAMSQLKLLTDLKEKMLNDND